MTEAVVRVLAVLMLTGAVGGAGSAERHRSAPGRAESELQASSLRSGDIDAQVQSIFEASHVAGLAAGIVDRTGLIWTGAYGTANFDTGTPVSIHTLFMLASTSKVVTATGLMQLFEEGAFALDDDVDDHLSFAVTSPSHPATPLTVRMVLSHVSGIRDNWGIMPYHDGDSPHALGDYLYDYLDAGGALYDPALNYYAWAPGTAWQYSNIGIALAGHLVESIGELDFDTYFDQHVFGPLDMTASSWHLAGMDPTDIAMPYRWNGATHVAYGHYGYSDFPSGALRTSVVELSRFLEMYIWNGTYGAEQVLEASTIDLMLSHHYPALDPTQGLTWYSGMRFGTPVWMHQGGDLGVSTVMYFNRNQGVGVIVLTNGENDAMTNTVADLLYEYGRSVSVDVAPAAEPDAAFTLHPGVPNPMQSVVHLTYELFEEAPDAVSVTIHGASGRLVRRLQPGGRSPGVHTVTWHGDDADGRPVASGAYFYRVSVGDETETRRVLLAR